MDLEIHYLKTLLNLLEGGSLDRVIHIFPLKKSSIRVISNSKQHHVILIFSTSPQCKDMDFVLLVENVYGIP